MSWAFVARLSSLAGPLGLKLHQQRAHFCGAFIVWTAVGDRAFGEQSTDILDVMGEPSPSVGGAFDAYFT
jgi:hypothetical protein